MQHMGCMSKHETRRGGYAPWCSMYGDMWRTSNDINADWQNVLSNLETLVGRGGDAGPFVGWNDPDILEVGVTRPKLTPLTLVEAQSHFALCVPHLHLIYSFVPYESGHTILRLPYILHVVMMCIPRCRWSVTSSPLLLGMPLTNASVVGTPQWKAMMEIVMNNESIAVNQNVSEQIIMFYRLVESTLCVLQSLTVCWHSMGYRQFVDKPVGGLPIAGDRLIPPPEATKSSANQVWAKPLPPSAAAVLSGETTVAAFAAVLFNAGDHGNADVRLPFSVCHQPMHHCAHDCNCARLTEWC